MLPDFENCQRMDTNHTTRICVMWGLVNARSVHRKTGLIKDHVIERDLDLLALAETWLMTDDHDRKWIHSFSPAGYNLSHVSRSDGQSSGVLLFCTGKVFKWIYKRTHPASTSFESMVVHTASGLSSVQPAIAYSPSPSRRNKLTTPCIFTEFSDFLEVFATSRNFVVMGNINIHWNKSDNDDSKEVC